jgi:hypothetical protein
MCNYQIFGFPFLAQSTVRAVPCKEAKQAKPPERKFLDTKSLNAFKNVMNCLFNVWRCRETRSLLFLAYCIAENTK